MSVAVTDIRQSGDVIIVSGIVNGQSRQVKTSASELSKLLSNKDQIDVLTWMLSQSNEPDTVFSAALRLDEDISLTMSAPSVTSGGSVTATITVKTISQLVDRLIVLDGTPSVLLSVPSFVAIPKGQMSATVTVRTIFPNAGIGLVRAQIGNQTQFLGLLVFSPIPILTSLKVSPISVVGGSSFTVTATVDVGTNPLELTGQVINMYSSAINANESPVVPASILVPRNSNTGSVTVSTTANQQGMHRIVASHGGVTKVAIITIT